MAPWPNGTAEPRKDRRYRPCWRTCSCITRSTRGWPGSSRPWSSSDTQTMRSCIARRSGRPAGAGRARWAGWRRSGCGCTRPRPRSCTARTTTGGALTSTRRSRSSGTRSGPGAPESRREDVHGLPARGQPGRAQDDGPAGPRMADPHAHQARPDETRRLDQPGRARAG